MKKEEQNAYDAALAAMSGTYGEKPTYQGTYEDQVKGIYDKIANREKFSYDVNADPLYQTYKDKYIQGGKLAMKDTMGQASALTGGYGNSYSQQVGQQAYDAYLQNLTDAIPELYGQALDKYNQEGNDLLKQYQLVGDMRDAEYNRYRTELGDWENERAWQKQLETEAYNRARDEENTAYSKQQQAYSNLYALIKSSGYNPTDAELAAAGMSREAAQALINEYTRGITPATTASTGSSGGSSGGGRSSGGGSSGGGSSYRSGSDVLAIQRQLNAMGAGLAEDGIWGPKTQAAYEKYMGGGAAATGTTGTTSTGTTTGNTSVTNVNQDQADAYAYLQYLYSQGYTKSSQVVQSFARAHGISLTGNGGR